MERYRKIVSVLLTITLLGIFTGYVLTEPTTFGLCSDSEGFGCVELLDNKLGQPLGLVSISVAIVLFIILFLPRQVFSLWKKWAMVLLPLSLFLIILTPLRCSAALGMCFDKELTTFWVSALFLIISLIVIIYKSIQLHRNKKGRKRT